MATLKIAIDPGSSATKVVYQIAQQPIQYFTMSPYCAEVPSDYPDGRRFNGKLPHLEDAWINNPDGCFLLGEAAKKFPGASILDGDVKYEKALYKVLGILAHVQHLGDRSLPIELGVLLPFDEYATQQELQKLLHLSCERFQYCTRPQSLNLERIDIFPEGTGLLLSGLPKKIDLACHRVAVLVIGHRNTSWLMIQQGIPVLQESITNDLGFRWLVQEVRKRSGYKDELRLAAMITNGHRLNRLVQQALMEVLPLYLEQLKAFLEEQPPTDFVLCGGGVTLFLQEHLQQFFGDRLIWAKSLSRALAKLGVSDPQMKTRLHDCYGLFLSLGA